MKYVTVNKAICEELETLNIDYKDMIEYFDIKISINSIRSYFSQFGVKHKKKNERIYGYVKENFDKPCRFLAYKCRCSPNTIYKTKRRILDDRSND